MCSFYLILNGMLIAGAIVYFSAFIFDFIDGNIARYYKSSNYFGKFIDGLVDSSTFLLFSSVGYYFWNLDLFNSYNKLIFYLSIVISFFFLFSSYFNARISFLMLEMKSSRPILKNKTEKKLAKKFNSKIEFIKNVVRIILKTLSTLKLANPLILLYFSISNQPDYFILISVLIYVILGSFEILFEVLRNYKNLNTPRNY
jgi:phosphatidylglycerophosphate synthase